MAPNSYGEALRSSIDGTLVLAKRGEAPSCLKTMYVALIVASFILFVPGFFLLAYFGLDTNVFGYLIFGLLFLLLAAISLALSLSVIIRAGMNEEVEGDPIVYEGKENKLILTSLRNKRILIDPSRVKRVSYGLAYDYFFFLTYVDLHGRRRRVNLGFVLNPDEVEKRLVSLKGGR